MFKWSAVMSSYTLNKTVPFNLNMPFGKYSQPNPNGYVAVKNQRGATFRNKIINTYLNDLYMESPLSNIPNKDTVLQINATRITKDGLNYSTRFGSFAFVKKKQEDFEGSLASLANTRVYLVSRMSSFIHLWTVTT